ncbi:hypothetical protein AWS33_10500 [Enterobacter cloacae subsp. cloacae]|nr:hypothetical protein AWS33_10500 [Enterobacter cloacae subsp. cloacae]
MAAIFRTECNNRVFLPVIAPQGMCHIVKSIRILGSMYGKSFQVFSHAAVRFSQKCAASVYIRSDNPASALTE